LQVKDISVPELFILQRDCLAAAKGLMAPFLKARIVDAPLLRLRTN
jgi:hypothetical protein